MGLVKKSGMESKILERKVKVEAVFSLIFQCGAGWKNQLAPSIQGVKTVRGCGQHKGTEGEQMSNGMDFV